MRRQSSKPYKRHIAVYDEDNNRINIVENCYSYTQAIDDTRRLYPKYNTWTLSARNFETLIL